MIYQEKVNAEINTSLRDLNNVIKIACNPQLSPSLCSILDCIIEENLINLEKITNHNCYNEINCQTVLRPLILKLFAYEIMNKEEKQIY